jgi:hypothetical protein
LPRVRAVSFRDSGVQNRFSRAPGKQPTKDLGPASQRLFDESRLPIVLVVVLALDSPAIFDSDYDDDDEGEEESACGLFRQALASSVVP